MEVYWIIYGAVIGGMNISLLAVNLKMFKQHKKTRPLFIFASSINLLAIGVVFYNALKHILS